MLRLNKTHPKQPVPDWRVTFDGIEFREKTADELIKRVAEYRRHNGIVAGNPEHEIALEFADSHPHLVREDDDATPAVESKLWAWINGYWRDVPRTRATDDEIKRRKNACTGCPFALAIPRNLELERRAYLLAQGQLALETQCAHHRWHNGLAILLAEPQAWARKGQPACCWVETEPAR